MSNENLPVIRKQELPAITEQTLPALDKITAALGVPRTVLASNDDIEYAWRDIPRELSIIPPELRNVLIVRMCVAIATGLFDGAINYVWNASIMQLRQRVRDFGLHVVSQILGKQFDDQDLIDKQDADLLELCLKLNLISEDGYFFLNQCRDIRNNYSAAHPNIGMINDRELLVFINRCAQYALSTAINPRGVDINGFIGAIKGDRFTSDQLNTWYSRLNETHDAQRELLFGMLHGIYCDPASAEQVRLNALDISIAYGNKFTPRTKSNILDRHYDYQAKGDSQRYTASKVFFEKLGFLGLLNELDRHTIVSNACDKLLSLHMAFNNFYNEPPFAERLAELSSQSERPESVKEKFVLTVITCFVGNPYGVSHAAIPYYTKMIKSFTPREIAILIDLPDKKTIFSNRIKDYPRCKSRLNQALLLVDSKSVPESIKSKFYEILQPPF